MVAFCDLTASLAQGCQPGKSLVPKTWRQGWPWRYTQLLQFKQCNTMFARAQRRVGKLWRARARRLIFSVWRFKIVLGTDFRATAPD